MVAVGTHSGRGLDLVVSGISLDRSGSHLDDDDLDHRCRRLPGDVGEAGLAEMTNLSDQPMERPTSFVSQRGVALTVYILYLIGYLTGFTALIGVIIAHVKAPSSDDILRSHYRFQFEPSGSGFCISLSAGSLPTS